MEVILSLAIVLSATVVILNIGWLAGKEPLSVSSLDYINTQAKYLVTGRTIRIAIILRMI